MQISTTKDVKMLKKMLNVANLHLARIKEALEPEYEGDEVYDKAKVKDLGKDITVVENRLKELS